VKIVMFGSDVFAHIYRVSWIHFWILPINIFCLGNILPHCDARYRKSNIQSISSFDRHKTTKNHTNSTTLPTLGWICTHLDDSLH
jgi:hypothetical protein